MAESVTATPVAPLTRTIHDALDRLRTLDWSTRPAVVESALGTLHCDYEEALGTTGWVCLNGQVQPEASQDSLHSGRSTLPAQEIRIWIPRPRGR
jgi:hypothetical protein